MNETIKCVIESNYINIITYVSISLSVSLILYVIKLKCY